MKATDIFKCRDCGYIWEEPAATSRKYYCPRCDSEHLDVLCIVQSNED